MTRRDRFPSRTVSIVTSCLILASISRSRAEVTFTKDVSPIFQKHCQECHRPGEAAPMSLLTYEDARPWAKSIKKAVQTRQMPPWHADPSIGKFKNDRSLSQKEIETVAAWVDGATPMGNPADMPPPRKFVEGWKNGRPDMVFKMDKEQILPPELADEYRYVTIRTGLTEDRWIKSVEVRPGNRAVVHHVIIFTAPDLSQDASHPLRKRLAGLRKGRPAGLSGGLTGGLGGYAPGTERSPLPDGYGIPLKANSLLVLQMHYHKEKGQEARDLTSIGVQFCTAPVIKQVRSYPMANRWFTIPAGADDYEVDASIRTPADVFVRSIMPHMHLRGKDMRVTAQFPDGRSQDLLFVPKYDFNWQTVYELADPVFAPKGTQFKVAAHYDNSAKNPNNPNPNQKIRWGQPTTSEMMIAFFQFELAGKDTKFIEPESSPPGEFTDAGL